jgi:hypothetical protein
LSRYYYQKLKKLNIEIMWGGIFSMKLVSSLKIPLIFWLSYGIGGVKVAPYQNGNQNKTPNLSLGPAKSGY